MTVFFPEIAQGGRVKHQLRKRLRLAGVALFGAMVVSSVAMRAPGQNRFATSDNQSSYVHWIDLYDANNVRIDPTAESPPPYDPAKTCGRCHDYDVIAHGWHFNAIDPNIKSGRKGFPWVWSDHRTGTYLPLSYRKWARIWSPDKIGLSRWEVAAHFGGYLPGGGVGSADSLQTGRAATKQAESGGKTSGENEESRQAENEQWHPTDRAHITGPLPVDCMLCHRGPASGYNPFMWTEQIEDQNFAYAPTAAAGLATVSGSMARLRDDFDPKAEGAADRLPRVEYDLSRFRPDGKVFFDIVRKPSSNACYYCHTNMAASAVQGSRWRHDEDVHLRAGMECADCHRNGLGHHTVRGFPGEENASGTLVASFSCRGCHMGVARDEKTLPMGERGRMGAPYPQHRGLPPLHLEKMTCTSCHSGPLIEDQLERQLNSMIHRLGEHVKRSGEELPAIVAGAQLPIVGDKGTMQLAPHRVMWPSYWAIRDPKRAAASIVPLHPERVYDLVRRALRVRRDFHEEIGEVRLSLSQRTELLGEDRARVREEDWTEEERERVEKEVAKLRQAQVAERMAAALKAIEEAYPGKQAVFVSGGAAFVRKGDEAIEALPPDKVKRAAEPYTWPLAHNVRPARQALGAGGCTDCHRDDSPIFNATLKPIGVLPDQETQSVAVHELQKLDMNLATLWNQAFAGRELFKVVGWIFFLSAFLVAIAAGAWNLGAFWHRRMQ